MAKLTFLLISFLLIFSTLSAKAQLSTEDQAQVDSLKAVVTGDMHDTFKLKAMRNWSNLIYYADPELDLALNYQIDSIAELRLKEGDLSKVEERFYFKYRAASINMIGRSFKAKGDVEGAQDYYLKSLEMSEKIDHKQYISMNLMSLGNISKEQGDYMQAKYFYLEGLAIDQELGDKEGIANYYLNLGSVHIDQGNDVAAIEYMFKSLSIQEELENAYGIGLVNVNLGTIYKQQEEDSLALEHYNTAFNKFDSIGYQYGCSACLANIGNIYQNRNEYQKAIDYQLKALAIRKELNNQFSIAHSYSTLGSIYRKIEQYDKSIDYYQKSLSIRRSIEDKAGIARSLTELGFIQETKAQYQSAIDYGTESLQIAQDIGALNDVEYAAKLLWMAYKGNKQFSQALEMLELYKNTRDSILSEKNQKQILKQQFKYDYEKQYMADSLAFAQQEAMNTMKYEVELEREAKQRYLLYGGLGFLAILGIVLYRGYAQKQADNKLILNQKQEVEKQKQIVEHKNEEIIDSINYARRIQRAILPPMAEVKEALPDSFIFYQPKDIVAGDFYWMKNTEDGVFIAAADCTGHGVPGAMVSVVCNGGLNRSCTEFGITSPGGILDRTRELVIEELDTSKEGVQDGMDIALCRLDGNRLWYAGANNPLWLYRAGELIAYKADKQPIGKSTRSTAFTTHEITVEKEDVFYLFSDGFSDQFGGEKGKKYMSGRFKKFLLSIHQEAMDKQKQLIEEELKNWMGNQEQVDDICVIGVRV